MTHTGWIVRRIHNNQLQTYCGGHYGYQNGELTVLDGAAIYHVFQDQLDAGEFCVEVKYEVDAAGVLRLPQTQCDLKTQLDRLEHLAVQAGLYDAHDWLRARREGQR